MNIDKVGRGKLTIGRKECDGGTLGTSTTGSPNAVNIIFRVIRVVIVQHMSDVTNILKLYVSTSVSRVSKTTKNIGSRDPAVCCMQLSCALYGYGILVQWEKAAAISWPGNLGRDCNLSYLRSLILPQYTTMIPETEIGKEQNLRRDIQGSLVISFEKHKKPWTMSCCTAETSARDESSRAPLQITQ